MKKIFFVWLVALSITGSASPKINSSVSSHVLNVFNSTFHSPKNVKWTVSENEYSAFFLNTDGNSTSVVFDINGKLVRSRRTVSEEALPLNILVSLKDRYRDREVKIATENFDEGSLFYSVTLEDATSIVVVEVSASGYLQQKQKFNKQK